MANENSGRGPGGAGGGRGAGGRGPGGPGGGGFEFGGGRGRGGDRDRGGRGGDRRGGRGGREREGGGGGAYRVANELPNLEKALTKQDFAAQKSSLEQILKAIRPLRLKSLEDLDLATRGKLLTSLVRVQRQNKPAGFDEFVAQQGKPVSAPAEAPAAEAVESPAAAEAAAPEAETGSAAEAAPSAATTEEAAPAEVPTPAEAAPETAAEGTETGSPEAAASEAAPSEDAAHKGYQDVLFLVGRVWRAAGEKDRALAAFELSGKAAPAGEEPVEAEAPQREEKRGEKGPRGERRERRERGERPERGERGERREGGAREAREKRPQREPVNIPVGGNWQEVAKEYETAGRTRDAARVHERNQSWVEAARLFEAGGNPREALRCALAAKDMELARKFLANIPMDQARGVLEKANAWELLMERYVASQDFESVARLYERSRQFDQAALAWEKAGKFAAARKAYERARDFKNAQRVKNLEIDKLVERGDRLGAAQILTQAGRKDEAVAILLALPAPKAYRFMERLKLDEAAKSLAKRELEKATQENKPSARARWLEMLDDNAQAAEAWAQAGRLERASVCNEKSGNLKPAAEQAEAVGDLDRAQDLFRRAGDTENQNRVAALPRLSPEERKKRQKVSAEEEAEDREHEAAQTEAASTPTEAQPSEEQPSEEQPSEEQSSEEPAAE